MLVLLFQHDQTIYALETRLILEVVPQITPQPIAGAPTYLLGICQYRGTPTPVVDFFQRVHQQSAGNHLSTRMVLLESAWADHPPTPLGLVVPKALQTEQLELNAENTAAVQVEQSPCLGRLVHHHGRFVQLVEPDRLLTEQDRQLIVRTTG